MALFASTEARAEPRRLALLVANNTGGPEQKPLRYAEQDADKLAHVLSELGGWADSDIILLKGRSVPEVKDAMTRVSERVQTIHSRPGDQALLLFYFSGHSDGEAMEVGSARLPYRELRRWLEDTGADLRLAVVDACKAGGLLAAKGGALGPAFELRIDDRLAATGEAFITSSAADEVALESGDIRGSYFTHHLVSALRGAADESGDGDVTLAEAYPYVFSHTRGSSASTTAGPQHPSYDYRISGRGDLVLARTRRATAFVHVNVDLERAVLIGTDTDQVVAELGRHSARRVAVAPGYYELRLTRKGEMRAVNFRVRPGETQTVTEDGLTSFPVARDQAKGMTIVDEPRPARDSTSAATAPWSLAAGLGTTSPIANSLGPLLMARFEVSRGAGWSWAASLEGATRNADSGRFKEERFLVRGGVQWSFESGVVRTAVGLHAGGGVVLQPTDGLTETPSSAMFVAGPAVGLEWKFWRPLSLGPYLNAEATLLKKDNQFALGFLPSFLIHFRVSL